MLHLAHKITGASVRGVDGDIGTLEDFYFEEDRWTVRYLLVDTGKWFSGKRVLISPMSVPDGWGRDGVRLTLTKEQVWNSPEIKEVLDYWDGLVDKGLVGTEDQLIVVGSPFVSSGWRVAK